MQSGSGGQSNWSMEAVNYEGWRVTVDQGDGRRGWLLLRQSLHDPLLVLNVESDQEGGKHCAADAAAVPVRWCGKHSFTKPDCSMVTSLVSVN
jgi:hypothetical protein